jgi:hypothetical protein
MFSNAGSKAVSQAENKIFVSFAIIPRAAFHIMIQKSVGFSFQLCFCHLIFSMGNNCFGSTFSRSLMCNLLCNFLTVDSCPIFFICYSMFALTQTLPNMAVVRSLLDFDKIPASLTVQKHTGFLVGKITKTELMIKLFAFSKKSIFCCESPYFVNSTFFVRSYFFF